jgi:hypothetical protein
MRVQRHPSVGLLSAVVRMLGQMQSAFAKLGRAKAHRDTLDADVKVFRDRDPHGWNIKPTDHPSDPSLGVLTIRLEVREPTPPEWGLIVGDILTNLRAALDHTVVGHAAKRSQQPLTEQEEKKLNFPILLNQKQWLGAPAAPATATTPATPKVESAHKKLVKYLDPAVLDVIEKSQPYHNAPPEGHPLGGLNDLVNRDKHRAVQVVSYIRKRFEVEKSDVEVVWVDAPDVPMTDGSVVATLHVRRPQPRAGQQEALVPTNFHFINEYGERLDMPGLGYDADVRGVMNVLVDGVEKVLIDLQAAGC